MKKIDLFLQTAIYELIARMPYVSECHVIYSRYYFLGVQMSTYEPVYISRQTVREIFLVETGIRCQMMLDAQHQDGSSSIFIPFDGIEKIIRVKKVTDRESTG